MAVEPTGELRPAVMALHPSPWIDWVDDSLPEFASLGDRKECFDLVMLTAVWMPSAADRSRGEAGRSLPPGPGQNAGPAPACWAQRQPRIPPSAPPAPIAPHRRRDTQLPRDLRQRPATAHQQRHRLPLELFRELTTPLAHSTPSRSSGRSRKGVHQCGGGSLRLRPIRLSLPRRRRTCACPVVPVRAEATGSSPRPP
jgi:hypothetical protein